MLVHSFWQSDDPIPAYLKACLDTWRIYAPYLELKIIDHKNWDLIIGDIIPLSEKIKALPYAIQSDVASACALFKFGGACLDIDTIMCSRNVDDFFRADDPRFTAFGMPKLNSIHVAALKVGGPENAVARLWVDEIRLRLKEDLTRCRPTYLANHIIEPYIRKTGGHDFRIIDRFASGAIPEAKECFVKADQRKNYIDFWFGEEAPESFSSLISRASHGILLLHNSWTPADYKNLDLEAFNSDSSFMSRFLKNILAHSADD